MNVKKTKKFKENHPENYHVHDIVSLNNLVQKDRELRPPLLGVLPQLLDGREDDHCVLHSGIHINHLGTLSLFKLSDPSFQTIILDARSVS